MNPWFISSVPPFLSVVEVIKTSFREKEDVAEVSVCGVTHPDPGQIVAWTWSSQPLSLKHQDVSTLLRVPESHSYTLTCACAKQKVRFGSSWWFSICPGNWTLARTSVHVHLGLPCHLVGVSLAENLATYSATK